MSDFLPVSIPVKGEDLAVALFNSPLEAQFEFFASFATLLNDKQREDLLQQIITWANEEESIALAKLGEALNERD